MNGFCKSSVPAITPSRSVKSLERKASRKQVVKETLTVVFIFLAFYLEWVNSKSSLRSTGLTSAHRAY